MNDEIVEMDAPLKEMDEEYYRLSRGAYRYPTMSKSFGSKGTKSFSMTVE